MPSRALIFLLLAASSMGAHAQNDAPPTWTIRAAISGNQLVGEWAIEDNFSG